MAKRPITKIDLVPEWLRQTIAEQAVEEGCKLPSQLVKAHQDFPLPDALVPEKMKGVTKGSMRAEFYGDPAGISVVSLKFADLPPGEFETYQEFENSDKAKLAYDTMVGKLTGISSIANAQPEDAKKQLTELMDTLKGISEFTPAEGTGTRSNSSLHQTIAEGWNIIEKKGELQVEFSKDFLSTLLSSYKAVDSIPNHIGEVVYTTSSRQHCGADNFVVSYWRKASTEDGNIIRNAALLSRIGGESYIVSDMPREDFNILCASLTPEPKMYGIKYDSVTGTFYKTAAASVFFTSTPEEYSQLLEYLGKGKKLESAELELPEEKGKKKKEEKEEKEEKGEKGEKEETAASEAADEAKLNALLEGTALPGAAESPAGEESLPLGGAEEESSPA